MDASEGVSAGPCRARRATCGIAVVRRSLERFAQPRDDRVGFSSSAGENQRASTTGAIDATPRLRDRFDARIPHFGSAIFAAVLARTSRSTRSGALIPIHIPTMPPIDKRIHGARDRKRVEKPERIRGPAVRSNKGPE